MRERKNERDIDHGRGRHQQLGERGREAAARAAMISRERAWSKGCITDNDSWATGSGWRRRKVE